MPFWTYMLQCRDRTLYVGHTDNLDLRLAQHEQGTFGGYTRRKRPVTLVWCSEFPSRYDALTAERQIKGWRKERKLALIRDDWAKISRLAREKKERPSTSSGRTGERSSTSLDPLSGRPELVEAASTSSAKPLSVFLHPHLDHLPSEPFSLQVTLHRTNSRLHIGYRLTGPVELIRVPKPAPSVRRDGLWRHTCFEAFTMLGGSKRYSEFNLAPSTEWAAYQFRSHRAGMETLALSPPRISIAQDSFSLELKAVMALQESADVLRLNLAAVVEETSGVKSYWALAHPPGEPDFHHPDCFTLQLPPAGRT